MKANDKVTYVDEHAGRHTATVTEVTGAGDSGYKKLNIALDDGRTFTDVLHEKDREASTSAFWTQDEPKAAPQAQAEAGLEAREGRAPEEE